VDPTAHVAVRKHHRTGVNEHRIRADVVQMIVRIDHKSHRQLRQCSNRREELFRRLSPELAIRIGAGGRVDHGDTIIADDESHVRAGGRVFGPSADARNPTVFIPELLRNPLKRLLRILNAVTILLILGAKPAEFTPDGIVWQ